VGSASGGDPLLLFWTHLHAAVGDVDAGHDWQQASHQTNISKMGLLVSLASQVGYFS
jgi:hypothetical protein